LGEYGYAVNALYSKKVIRDALLEKVRGAVTSECKDLCSVKTPSLLRDTSPTGLKQFSEGAHVAELAEGAPILYLLLSAAVGKPIPKQLETMMRKMQEAVILIATKLFQQVEQVNLWK